MKRSWKKLSKQNKKEFPDSIISLQVKEGFWIFPRHKKDLDQALQDEYINSLKYFEGLYLLNELEGKNEKVNQKKD